MMLYMDSHERRTHHPLARNNQALHFGQGFPPETVSSATPSSVPVFGSPHHVSPTAPNYAMPFSSSPQVTEMCISQSMTTSDHGKRGRDDEDTSSERFRHSSNTMVSVPQSQQQDANSSFSKRSRENKYIAPRFIPQTVTSAMGTLTQSAHAPLFKSSSVTDIRVDLRRQLSSSRIDSFISSKDQNSMDLDNSERNRRMSF